MAAFNFGGGCPDPGSVPTQGLSEAAARVLPGLNVKLANYPEPQGHRPLREVAAARFERREGVALDPDAICLANGSQQPITLFCQALLSPGKPVIVEEFTYPGTLRAMRHVGATIVGVPVDEEGMRVDALAGDLARLEAAGTPPGFIYTTPTYQNPTGCNMSVARRRDLLSLSRRYGVPIVDDNCYGDLDFDGPPPPSIKALELQTNDQRPGGRPADTTNEPGRSSLVVGHSSSEVILFESFSKIVGAGIRLGYFACDRERRSEVMAHKIDGGTSVLSAAILAEYLKDHLADHVATITRIVREKRDTLFSALDRHLGDCCTWTHPRGGYFIWVRVPDGCDVVRLDELAVASGIAYGMGRAFHYANAIVPYFRLSFAYPSLDEIEEGIRTMAGCVREAMPQRVMVTV